jgi:hypothetical protein
MKWLYEKYIAIFVDAQIDEIKSAGIIKSIAKTNRIYGSGWGRIPNIKDLQINLGSYNKIFKLIGMNIREDTRLTFTKLHADRMNRFMLYQLWKLSYYRERDPEKYFKLSWALMKSSVSFRVSAINHVFKGWYKELPLWVVLRINRRVDKIIREQTAFLDFSRVYIPKGGKDKVRPLGVPAPEWRLYLHMVNNFMHWYMKDYMLQTQHGFMPGRGSLTAWKDIFTKGWIFRDYIYECDLKQFFPSVKLSKISQTLLENKVPEWVVNYLHKLNSTIPKIIDKVSKDMTDEQQVEALKNIEDDKRKNEEQWADPISSVIQNLQPLHQIPGRKRLKPRREPTQYDIINIGGIPIKVTSIPGLEVKGIDDIEREESEDRPEPGFFQKKKGTPKGQISEGDVIDFNGVPITITGKLKPLKKQPLMSNDPAEPYYLSTTGVPQGAPTSPFLSITILKDFLSNQKDWKGGKVDSISYADDPVFFGDQPFHIWDDPKSGINIHPGKSGWVKYGGEWLKPLKFLGLEFNGKELYANTRNGSKLLLTKDVRQAVHAINTLEHEMWRDISKHSGLMSSKERVLDNWYNLFKSRLIGHLVSRMYIGDWNLKDYEQDFGLKFVTTSWLDLKWQSLKAHKPYTIFNASSYASWSLAEILRHRYKSKPQIPKEIEYNPFPKSTGDWEFGRTILDSTQGKR